MQPGTRRDERGPGRPAADWGRIANRRAGSRSAPWSSLTSRNTIVFEGPSVMLAIFRPSLPSKNKPLPTTPR